jgi:hypothetical protein
MPIRLVYQAFSQYALGAGETGFGESGECRSKAVDISLSRSIYSINPKHEIRNRGVSNKSKIQMFKIQNKKRYTMLLNSFCFDHLRFGHLNLFRISIFEFRIFLNSTALEWG